VGATPALRVSLFLLGEPGLDQYVTSLPLGSGAPFWVSLFILVAGLTWSLYSWRTVWWPELRKALEPKRTRSTPLVLSPPPSVYWVTAGIYLLGAAGLGLGTIKLTLSYVPPEPEWLGFLPIWISTLIQGAWAWFTFSGRLLSLVWRSHP
jgi:hypothetical protein